MAIFFALKHGRLGQTAQGKEEGADEGNVFEHSECVGGCEIRDLIIPWSTTAFAENRKPEAEALLVFIEGMVRGGETHYALHEIKALCLFR